MSFIFVTLVSSCLLISGGSPQIVGWGIQNSIGISPFPPSSFFPNSTKGVNDGRDFTWPNGIIPYDFDNSTISNKLLIQD